MTQDKKELRIAIQFQNEDDFYKKYFFSISGLLGNLTNTEREIVAEICALKNKLEAVPITQEEKDELLFTSKFRKKICENLNITSYNFNNYLKRLVEKQVIIYKEKQYFLAPNLFFSIVNLNQVTFTIDFKRYDKDNTSNQNSSN